MAYDVYFDKVLLPVAPSKIKTSIKNKNKTIELINEGEVNLLKDAGLTEIAFTISLPNSKYPFAKYTNGFKGASYFLNVFEKYKKNKQPFQLIISRTLPTGKVLFYTNIKVSLEDYDVEDNAKDGFDTTVTINLLQYKEYGTKTVNVSAYVRKTSTTSTRSAGSGSQTAGKQYTVKSGDTLWGIAKKMLGSGTLWKEIYNANKSVIEKAAKSRGKASSNNGHWIFPGTKLTIPATSSNSTKSSSKSSTKKTTTTTTTTSKIKSSGGSKTNPPYSIVDKDEEIVHAFNSYREAYAYYNIHNGLGKQWRLVDASAKVVEL